MKLLRAKIVTVTRQQKIKNRFNFEKLARRNDIPGLKDIWVCKFLITGVDTSKPKLYIMNTKDFEHHYQFYKIVTGNEIPESEFDKISYYTNKGRKNLAGSIVAHNNYSDDKQKNGIYSIEYWATDPVSYEFLILSWELLLNALHFAKGKVYYHLSSQTQINQYLSEKELFVNSPIRLIDTDTLFNNLTYIPLNLGDSYGILRIMDSTDIPAFHDIVIFRSLPNDLSHVRGIITDVAQTPLSHVNLKAKQNNIPNAYIKNASTKEDFLKLVGKAVRYTVTPDGYEIKEVSQQELNNNLQDVSPLSTNVPEMNLTQKKITSLQEVFKIDSATFGAKASNMGELQSLLDEKFCINGYAIPFFIYDCFMKENNFYPLVNEMIGDEKFNTDIHYKSEKLKEFKELVSNGKVPDWMRKEFSEMQAKFPGNSDLRLRSSSNSEDLENFNGAGLYSSLVHFAKDGPIEDTIKKVWASLWTYRAFVEREFHKIDHSSIAMGILVHLDYKQEQFNGVAVTKNLFGSVWDGFYINVQTGQSLVTNPDSEALPDELLVSAVGAKERYEIQYIRHSNLVPKGQTVMQEKQVFELIEQCRIIHVHFKKCYRALNDKDFAMEIEFLTTTDGNLKIMQARPWLD